MRFILKIYFLMSNAVFLYYFKICFITFNLILQVKHTLNIESRNKRKKISFNPITLGGSFLMFQDVYKGEVHQER